MLTPPTGTSLADAFDTGSLQLTEIDLAAVEADERRRIQADHEHHRRDDGHDGHDSHHDTDSLDSTDLAIEHRPDEPIGPQVATRWLTGAHVLLVGIDHEPDSNGFTAHSLAIADHLATRAASVTVLSAVAHRPSWWSRPTAVRRLRRAARSERGEAGLLDEDLDLTAADVLAAAAPSVPAPPTPTATSLTAGTPTAVPAPTISTKPGATTHPSAGHPPAAPPPELAAAVPPAAGRPRVVRLDYHVAANQTAITRAAYEATHLAKAAAAAVPFPPELVIATTPSLGGVVAAARVARKHHAPLVVVVHDLMATAGAVSGALERHALASADVVAVTSEAFRAPVEAYGIDPARIHVLPAWARLERSALGRREARSALGWPTRGLLVVLTGEIGLKQDVNNVVEAAALLKDRRTVRFMIVGEGSQRRLLEEQTKRQSNLTFKDAMDADTLPLALAAADVLLVTERPGSAEVSSAGQLAACFGAGRPVVAALAPGGVAEAEVRRSGGAGIAVAAGDPQALADAIRALVDEPQRRAAMADLALDHARSSLAYRSSMQVVDHIVEAAFQLS